MDELKPINSNILELNPADTNVSNFSEMGNKSEINSEITEEKSTEIPEEKPEEKQTETFEKPKETIENESESQSFGISFDQLIETSKSGQNTEDKKETVQLDIDPEEPGRQQKEIDPDDETPSTGKDAKRKSGELIFTLTDGGLRTIAALIAGNGTNSSDFVISKSDKEELKKAWGDLADLYDWEKPPAWIVIVLISAFAYQGVFREAITIRKTANEKKKAEKKPTKTAKNKTAKPAPINKLKHKVNDLKPVKIPTKEGRGRRPKNEEELVKLIEAQNKQIEALKSA